MKGIQPSDLELWRVVDPKEDDKGCVDLDGTVEKSELKNQRLPLSALGDLTDESTFIFVRLPKRVSKRQREDDESETSRKARKASERKEYQAIDGPVDLPPALISLIDSDDFKPASRDEFKKALDGKKAGDEITLPSIGQKPKHYGQGFQGKSIFITEQMVEVWKQFSEDSEDSIKRVLAGPMGVGKSYLALFLAAKAYSEGWPVLYVSDASKLVKSDIDGAGTELCTRFFALNKDILTIRDFEKFWVGRERDGLTVASLAATVLSTLLCQRERKTLLVLDEHGKLFEKNKPYPHLFKPLTDIHSFDPAQNGARVIYTGTAHAGFELVVLTGDIDSLLEFVGPLSDFIFDKLLGSSPIPSSPDVLETVKTITHNVPRELVKLVEYLVKELGDLKNVTDKDIQQCISAFKVARSTKLYGLAKTYFTDLDDDQQVEQRKALSTMFQPISHGSLNPSNNVFVEPKFMDLGLIYRSRVRGHIVYNFLCPAAMEALLEHYRTMPLPKDKLGALESGRGTGNDFEEVFFRYVMWYKEFSLKPTDLAGNPKPQIDTKATNFDIMTTPSSKTRENTFRQLPKFYPRFDFVYNRTFFQLSISDFATHDTNSKEIKKAFEPIRPPKVVDAQDDGETSRNAGGTQKRKRSGSSGDDSTKSPKKKKQNAKNTEEEEVIEMRNQIEVYLDAVYGGNHEVKINPDTNNFEAKRNGVALDDFKIVYVCGLPGRPNHPKLVAKYPDLLYVSFDELRYSLFGDFYKGSGNGKGGKANCSNGKGNSNERYSIESGNSSPGP
ncbi:hypothetical protein BGZ76_001957 [Entomortierella beljakovae]|nr:hypothetical protein BGZ76_001957 [Entomortierella beljakovae]